MRKAIWGVVLGLAVIPCSAAHGAGIEVAEAQAIRQVALDYIEGWYEADVERMQRALHADLVKRHPDTLSSGRDHLATISANTMFEYTRGGGGSKTPKQQQRNEVVILDLFKDIATAKIISADFVDYLHLANLNGEWKIVNVLWMPRRELE